MCSSQSYLLIQEIIKFCFYSQRQKLGVDKTWTPLLDPESGPYSGPHSGPVIFFGEKKIKLGANSENCSSYFYCAEKTLETEILYPPFGDLARSST